jgi:hypothetical protein
MADTSTEYFARIHNDIGGYYTEVGPDGDCLGLCRISYLENSKLQREIILTWSDAVEVAKAIIELAPKNIEAPESNQS